MEDLLICISLFHFEGKDKVIPMLNQAPHHEYVWGSGGIDPRIFNLGTGRR
jgi:hypothetical protein